MIESSGGTGNNMKKSSNYFTNYLEWALPEMKQCHCERKGTEGNLMEGPQNFIFAPKPLKRSESYSIFKTPVAI